MKLFIEIEAGEIIPPWYGVAWANFHKDSAVCMPIPINVIAKICRDIVIWLRHGHVGVSLNSRRAYAEGFKHGRLSA